VIALLHRAAADVRPSVDALAAATVTQLRAVEPFYRHPFLAPDNVIAITREALVIALDTLDGSGTTAGSARFAWQLGCFRGSEGVPLAPLIRGYRIAARLLWEALAEAITGRHDDKVRLLVPAASTYWNVIDRDTRLLSDAYSSTRCQSAMDSTERIMSLLDALIDGRYDDVHSAGVAAELGIPDDRRIAVAVVRTRTAPAELRIPESPRMRLLRTVRNGADVVVACLGDGTLDDVAEVLAGQPVARIGISPVVNGLGQLGRATRLAETALLTCTKDGEVARLDARLPAGLLVSRPDLARELAALVLRPVLELAPTECDVLLGTLATWIDCEGSGQRAATQLYCHRNTVLNRLRRLEELTGRRLARPRDLVEIALALDALHLTGKAPAPRRGAQHS
jgi:hypothetical protein